MSNNSDHKRPYNNILSYLPEVYRSSINTSAFEMAFNRHLTKDDTSRVAGFIGRGNPQALIDRQVKEPTPHRQAFQLAPTMYTKVGTAENALSFKAFQGQLGLIGVDINRMDKWGDSQVFNWVPPINMDMLINYQDYFWRPDQPTDAAQYLTIENPCNKALSKVQSYNNVLLTRGSYFPVSRISYIDDKFIVSNKQDDLFVDGFVFYTDGTVNPNLLNKKWTVAFSTYDQTTNETTITLIESVASSGPIAPSDPYNGQWWYDTNVSTLKEWNDTSASWVLAIQSQTFQINLERQLQLYQYDANCACNQSYGWDTGQWDGVPDGMGGRVPGEGFNEQWDFADECEVNAPTAWGAQNRWIHKSQVRSFADVKRAQLPIIEYNSSLELNEWTEVHRTWKYRENADQPFAVTPLDPTRLELEPVKGFIVANVGGRWVAYLFDQSQVINVNIDYTSTFVPGFRFRVTDDTSAASVYTVDSSEYRQVTNDDPIVVRDVTGTGQFVTVVTLRETTYTAAVVGGGATYTRIEPIVTSAGDVWRGYHVHWVLVPAATELIPTAHQPLAYELLDGLKNPPTVLPMSIPAQVAGMSVVVAGVPQSLDIGSAISFATTGTFPTASDALPITPSTVLFVVARAPQTFSVSRTPDGLPLSFIPGTGQLTVTLPAHRDDGSTYQPVVGGITIAPRHQELQITSSGITRIDLVDQFRLIDGSSNVYATPNSNEVRVYVNEVRQYASYTEVIGTAQASSLPSSTFYTAVGLTAQTTQRIEYVKAIVFDQPLRLFDVVRIEVGPAAQADAGLYAVPVRTVEDEAQFAIGNANGTQPAYVSLSRYQRLEQSKRQVNQYPIFNIFDVTTGTVAKAASIFSYKEDSTATINRSTGLRINTDTTNRIFEFEQTLLDRDNNILYGYHNTSRVATYWYSPLQGRVRLWDGYAWNEFIPVTLPTGGVAFRRVHVSPLRPDSIELYGFWMDTLTMTLKQCTQLTPTPVYVDVVGLTISDADPLLETVWKPGLNEERYTPQYVDASLSPVAIGDPNGDWEVAHQWRYNPEHENRQYITYSQLITHFSTILAAQPKIPGLQGGGVYTLTQDQINYGVGGTIKEYNDSYDTLISAVNVTNTTPVGVLEFATQQYATSMLFVRDFFNKSIDELLSTTNQRAIADLQAFASEMVIDRYENNDFTGQTYDDTSAFDPVTLKGVRNWPATTPMFGLSPVYRPHLTVSSDNVQLFHHDGHRSDITYTGAELDRYARAICTKRDPRTGTTFGKVSPSLPPATIADYTLNLGAVRSVTYWYTTGTSRNLYRFAPISVSATNPALTYEDGTELPDGVKYYNTAAQAVFQKQNSAWVQITPIGSGDITELWERVSLPELLGGVQLEVETRLYEVTPIMQPAFDFSTLVNDTADQIEYQRLRRQRFNAFLATNNIVAPFVNADYQPSDAFTWNYANSAPLVPPRAGTVAPAGCWQQLYTEWYGTPYPNLEPWRLQGFTSKPTWWEDEYADTTGTRRWTPAMWTNIANGVVPDGRTYPDGSVASLSNNQVLTQYAYVSVNVSNVTIAGGYGPDDLLPPYYVPTGVPVTVPQTRSVFTNIAAEVTAPEADFSFGEVGPTEWAWTVSLQYNYDACIVAFLMQPVRFLHSTFGPKFVTVNDLQVETTFNQVYSHADALFHGDIYLTNQVYQVRGLNQWYVNYNRYSGIDTNGEFRQAWAGWKPRLTYQFAGIVDTSTFEIANKYFDVISQDYEIALVNNGLVRDMWVDAFEASLITIPPALIQYNNQSAWKIELDTLSPTGRDLYYYGVKSYQFTVDPVTDVCTAFQYGIVGANAGARRFTIVGDQTSVFQQGMKFVVAGSSGNDGTYTVVTSAIDTATGRTRITVEETVAQSFGDGTIKIIKSIPWQTGDVVVISSTKFLPAPLQPDTPYYVIRESNQTFKLAETPNDAILGNAIDVISTGDGALTVSQVQSSFYALGGAGNSSELWYHYAVDTTDVRVLQVPYIVSGMQTFINLVDGYSAYARNNGQLQNIADSNDFDPDTGRLSGWDVEVERFINWAYGLRQARVAVSDRYPVSVNVANDTLTFGSMVPMWLTGTVVTVTSTGELPQPLIDGAAYYVINTGTPGVIRLSTSASAVDTAAIVDFTTIGTGSITIGLYNRNRAFPRFELNATRNNIWIDTPRGVLSNAITGPYTDIRVNQTMFDQYGRPIGSDKVTVYREDQRSRVAIRAQLQNDVDAIYNDDPYNYIHLGGAHLFVEGYEHFLLFNNYTVGGALIYDPFFGLQAQKFSVDYFEKQEYTLRPTLGGFYLLDQQFYRNIEGSADDVKNYYDVLELSESTEVARRSRALLGYKGRTEFLDFLNINSKSQFLFYRGLIQSKGSVNSIRAYINSRRFVDAKMDEFWAWKLADFGDSRARVYPEIKLFSSDGALDDVRLEFLAASERETDDDIAEAIAKGFQPVSFRDDSRWYNFPEQKGDIKSPLFLDTEVSSLITVYGGVAPPPAGSERSLTYWFDTQSKQLLAYDKTSQTWSVDASSVITIDTVTLPNIGDTEMLYFRLQSPIDEARVVRKSLVRTNVQVDAFVSPQTLSVVGDLRTAFSAGASFALVGTDVDGAYEVVSSAFDGTYTTVTVTEPVLDSTVADGFIVLQDFTRYALEVYTAGSGIREVTRVDSQVLRFQLAGFEDVIQIFTLVPASRKLNPARLIDVKSHTVVQDVPMWDPARGLHSHVAIHNVDLQNDKDPATYEFTPNPNDSKTFFWNKAERGTVWLDTSTIGYVPYYDDRIFTDVNDRLYNWGKLAPWASINAYEWVVSSVPPDQWDRLVERQANDPLIAQNDKATGTPYRAVFKRVRMPYAVTAVSDLTDPIAPNTVSVAASIAVTNESRVLFTGTTLPDTITAGTKYVVSNLDTTVPGIVRFQLIDPVSEETITIPVGYDPIVNNMLVVPEFKAADWNNQRLIRDRVLAPFVVTDYRKITNDTSPIDWQNGYTIPVDPVTGKLFWKPTQPDAWVLAGVGSDEVSLYVNGALVSSNLPVQEYVGVTPADNRFYVELLEPLAINEYDVIDIVRPVHSVTQEEAQFNPDVEDDGTTMIQWKEDYQYSSTTFTVGGENSGTTEVTEYYFWVSGSTTRNSADQTSISVLEVERQLETIPTPYFVVQRPKDDPYLLETYGYGSIEYGSVFSTGILTEAEYQIPVLYREAIVRKVASYINDDDRYVLQFTRDFTLRDRLETNDRQFNLKNKHQEWFLFRRDQNSTIPRELWDRLTEALSGRKLVTTQTLTKQDGVITFAVVGQSVALGDVGIAGFALQDANGVGLLEGVDYTIDPATGIVKLLSAARITTSAPYVLTTQYTYTVTRGQNVRVPSLERELYDSLYGTDTQYGLGEDQAFVNKELGLNTIVKYLTDPNRDFTPIDIDGFFATDPFSSPESIERAMDFIYTTFNSTHVNAMWFEALHDALSVRSKYKEILKTSWVALHGIRVLEVAGLFDD